MAPKKKIARLQHHLVGACSDSDLASIGRLARKLPIESTDQLHASRHFISQTLKRDEELLALTFQMPSKRTDDDIIEWKICEPSLLVRYVVGSRPELQDVYAAAAKRSPPTKEQPWDLLVCFDEWSPGDICSIDNTRKTMVLSFNFEQLGSLTLQKDYSWMVPICVRTSKIKQVMGGWSHMLKRFFHTLLLGDHGAMTDGITVVVRESILVIYCRVKCLGSDYDGLRMAYDWRGASSLRGCLKCSNVFKKGSDLAWRCGNCVETTCVDKTQLIERSTEEFEDDFDLVTDAGRQFAAGEITKTAFVDIQMSTSQNFNPLGLFACPELRQCFRALDIVNQDWVHGLLCHGTLVIEMQKFFTAIGCTREDCEEFLRSDIRLPKCYGEVRQMREIFKRAKDDDDEDMKLRASASEFLGLYSLVRHFAELQFKDQHEGAHVGPLASFNALCAFVDGILDLKRGTAEPTDEYCEDLEDAYFEYLRLTIEAYGTDHLIPKTFLNHELPRQFRRMQYVFDAFICERIHLRVKKVAVRVTNTSDFEMSVLLRIVRAQIYAINCENALKDGCLMGKITRNPAGRGLDLNIALSLRIGFLISREDIVFSESFGAS